MHDHPVGDHTYIVSVDCGRPREMSFVPLPYMRSCRYAFSRLAVIDHTFTVGRALWSAQGDDVYSFEPDFINRFSFWTSTAVGPGR